MTHRRHRPPCHHPTCRILPFAGFEHISADMLGRINQLVPRAQIGLPYDDAAAQTEKTALLALGWYAAVDTTIEPVLDGVRLVFTVKENPTVLQVQVEGLKNLSALQQQLVLSPAKALQNLPSNTKTAEAVKGAMQQLGWFRNCSYNSQPVKDGVQLVYTVVEAPLINAVTFQGNTQLSNDDLAKAVGLHPGAVLNQDLVKLAGQAIEAAYAKKGYTQTRVGDATVSAENNLQFIISETVISKIIIEGNVQTSEETIRNALTFKEGDIYNSNAISESMRKLNALGVFKEVQVIAEPGKDPGTIDEKIIVKEN